MTVIKSLSGIYSPRRRPIRYRARNAPYAVGGNKGFYIAALPRAYPKTAQQRRVADVARQCGIRKGMDKSTLMTAMKDCVGPAMTR